MSARRREIGREAGQSADTGDATGRLDTLVAEAKATVAARYGADAEIVFVSGNFNVLHPGHIRLLQFARSNGDALIVGVSGDGTSGSTIEADVRLNSVQSLSIVDHAFIMPSAVIDVIRALGPAVVVKGREHMARDNPEQEILKSIGGRLVFNSGEMHYADIETIERQYQVRNGGLDLQLDYLERHSVGRQDLLTVLQRMRGLRVMVIGDLIIDEYIDCDPLGMSQEDATVVVSPVARHRFLGGSGIVAAHCAGLGARVDYLTVAPEGRLRDFAAERLSDSGGIAVHFFDDDSRPVTLKQRFRAQGRSLLRVSDLRQHAIDRRLQDLVMDRIGDLVDGTDAILFSDFNYGCLPTELVRRIADLAGRSAVTMAADSQSSSQLGDISRFVGMKLVTPTEREARLALNDAESGLVELAERLHVAASAENVILTLGEAGVLIHAPSYGIARTDRLRSMNPRPVDVAGAGDSLFGTMTLAMAAGADIWQAGYLGALAAACQVSRLGNTPLNSDDIERALS